MSTNLQGYCTYQASNGRDAVGVVTSQGVIATSKLGADWAALVSVDDVIASGREPALAEAALAYAKQSSAEFVALDSLTLRPCLTHPEKILMVGLNYRRHAAEVNKPLPAVPMVFAKFNNALAASGETIRLPSSKYSTKIDYECELVIVIGRQAYDVPEASALDYVFGYCVGNDLSARDLQNVTSQYLMGKGLDQFAPIGPFVAPSRVVRDPHDLPIACEVNGVTVQSSNTNDLIFNCAQIVSYCSSVMTLKPGDLIFTGTPEGVIAGKAPAEQKWLRKGDVVVIRIEGLGTLTNPLA